jgi:hypothetical protein
MKCLKKAKRNTRTAYELFITIIQKSPVYIRSTAVPAANTSCLSRYELLKNNCLQDEIVTSKLTVLP